MKCLTRIPVGSFTNSQSYKAIEKKNLITRCGLWHSLTFLCPDLLLTEIDSWCPLGIGDIAKQLLSKRKEPSQQIKWHLIPILLIDFDVCDRLNLPKGGTEQLKINSDILKRPYSLIEVENASSTQIPLQCWLCKLPSGVDYLNCSERMLCAVCVWEISDVANNSSMKQFNTTYSTVLTVTSMLKHMNPLFLVWKCSDNTIFY